MYINQLNEIFSIYIFNNIIFYLSIKCNNTKHTQNSINYLKQYVVTIVSLNYFSSYYMYICL